MLPRSISVPTELLHPRFVAVPLIEETAALDLAAYLASPDVIRRHSDGRWPADLDEATDLELVRDHWADHRARRAFAFTLLTPARDAGLGCLYLNPLPADLGYPSASAMVTFWLRQDHEGAGLAEAFVAALVPWLCDEWPLDGWLIRALPGERDSVAALDASDLVRAAVSVPGESRPYRWYEPVGEVSARRGGR